MAFAPIDISMALHYWTTGTDFPGSVGETRGPQMRVISELCSAGLLEVNPDGPAAYKATEAMRVYIDALLAVPYPVQKWVMPDAPFSPDCSVNRRT